MSRDINAQLFSLEGIGRYTGIIYSHKTSPNRRNNYAIFTSKITKAYLSILGVTCMLTSDYMLIFPCLPNIQAHYRQDFTDQVILVPNPLRVGGIMDLYFSEIRSNFYSKRTLLKRDNMEFSLQIYFSKSEHLEEAVCQVSNESVGEFDKKCGNIENDRLSGYEDKYPQLRILQDSWADNVQSSTDTWQIMYI